MINAICKGGNATTHVYKIVTQVRIASAVSSIKNAQQGISAGKNLITTGREMMKASAGTLTTYTAAGNVGGSSTRVAQGAKMIEEGTVLLQESKNAIKLANKAKSAPKYAQMSKLSKGLTMIGLVIDGVTVV